MFDLLIGQFNLGINVIDNNDYNNQQITNILQKNINGGINF